MTQPGYQPQRESLYWWKVALHLDEAQTALANAMAHNLDDQQPVFMLQDKLREGQALLLEIFRAKKLVPGPSGDHVAAPQAPPPPLDAAVESAGGPTTTLAGTQTVQPEPEPPQAEPSQAEPPRAESDATGPHSMLRSLAGAMRFRGAGYDEIEARLLAANTAHCKPPKSEDEVRAIARWATEQPMGTLSDSAGDAEA